MTTGKPKMPLIENCALCRVCGKGELSCSCDKPEPMSVDEAILLVLTGLGTERRQVAEVIRSLDERARRAERNFEQAAACHKEALCWYNEAKAQVAAQEQSHRERVCEWVRMSHMDYPLSRSCGVDFYPIGRGSGNYCDNCGGRVVVKGKANDGPNQSE